MIKKIARRDQTIWILEHLLYFRSALEDNNGSDKLENYDINGDINNYYDNVSLLHNMSLI